jgi:oligopeptide transport system substrate-binding protein
MGYFPESDLTFDPDKARALLTEAGYPDGAGFPKTEILYNTSEEHRKVAVAIQQMWKQYLNIDVTLLNQEWKVYLDSETNMDYEISRASWIGDYVDPNNFLDMWLCNGGNNRTGWCNPEYDRLVLEAAPKASSHEERLEIFKTAEKMLLADMPVLPIYIYTSKHLINPAIRNFPKNMRRTDASICCWSSAAGHSGFARRNHSDLPARTLGTGRTFFGRESRPCRGHQGARSAVPARPAALETICLVPR